MVTDDDTGGGRGYKWIFLDDVICERLLIGDDENQTKFMAGKESSQVNDYYLLISLQLFTVTNNLNI